MRGYAQRAAFPERVERHELIEDCYIGSRVVLCGYHCVGITSIKKISPAGLFFDRAQQHAFCEISLQQRIDENNGHRRQDDDCAFRGFRFRKRVFD